MSNQNDQKITVKLAHDKSCSHPTTEIKGSFYVWECGFKVLTSVATDEISGRFANVLVAVHRGWHSSEKDKSKLSKEVPA